MSNDINKFISTLSKTNNDKQQVSQTSKDKQYNNNYVNFDEVKQNIFINTRPVNIYLYDEDKQLIEKRVIQFPTQIVFNNNDNKTNTKKIFDKNYSKYNPIVDYDEKNKTYNVKHMNLLPWTTIEEFKYIVASVIKCDISTIFDITSLYNIEYVIDKQESTQHEIQFSKTNLLNQSDKLIYDNSIVIGYKQYTCHILKRDYTVNTSYDYKFYDNYLTITKYLTSLPNFNEISNSLSTRENILKNKSCQNIEVMLMYDEDKEVSQASKVKQHNNNYVNFDEVKQSEQHMNLTTKPIDIVKLFNINNINQSVKKILIHDTSLTIFNNEDREQQYVKTEKDLVEPFKNTFSRFNCCSIYVINEIFPSIVLSRIEFYKTGMIKCCFMINDPDMEYTHVRELLSTYFKDKFWRMFDKFHLDECIYDFTFNIKHLVPIYGSFSFIYTLSDVKAKLFTNFVDIANQLVPTVVFKTNTSIFISSYNSDCLELINHIIYSGTFRPTLSDTIIKLDVSAHSHVQILDNENVVIYFTKLYTIDDLILNATLYLLMFNQMDKTRDKLNSKSNDENLPLEQRVKNIRTKYQKIPTKKGIKKLNEIDPILFGTRLVNDTDVRPYSALAQKKEQRVVVVTKQEYETLHEYNTDYVINIKNQSQPTQRLYLFCPWDKYPYLNFHHYHNQLCIPKCTTAITKKTQYLYCNNQLEAKGYKNNFSNDSSKMIVYYSPLLLSGRKCFAPDELSAVCENYLLTKLPLNIDLLNYVHDRYNVYPCVLQRDNINKQYIMQNELETNKRYTLVIQSELDNGYYIVLDDENKPFIIDEHEEFDKFIKSVQTYKNMGYKMFSFIDDIFKFNLSKLYNDLTFKQMLNLLITKYNIKLVANNNESQLVGIVYKNILLFIPPIIFNKMSFTIDTININIALDSSTYPTLDMFNERFISKYYVDYDTSENKNMIKCIEYKGVNILVKPTKPTHDTQPLIYFDYDGYLNWFKFVSSKKIFIKNIDNIQQDLIIKQIVSTWLFVLLSYHQTTVDINKLLLQLPNITDENTKIVYINKSPSWKQSLINRNDFNNIYEKYFINISQTNMINIIYETIKNNSNIYNNSDYIKISSKIITNNTM